MRTIPLTQGKVAIVDAEDYEYLSQYKWFAQIGRYTYYAARRKVILMHRVILNAPKGVEVDHINGDGLDNRRLNLRLCNSNENKWHSGLYHNNSSGYKGVSPCKRNDKKPWRAFIQVNSKNTFLGCFSSPREAAKAYDAAALEHHRDFALTNKMLGLL